MSSDVSVLKFALIILSRFSVSTRSSRALNSRKESSERMTLRRNSSIRCPNQDVACCTLELRESSPNSMYASAKALQDFIHRTTGDLTNVFLPSGRRAFAFNEVNKQSIGEDDEKRYMVVVQFVLNLSGDDIQ